MMNQIEMKTHLSEQVESEAGADEGKEVAHCQVAQKIPKSHHWGPGLELIA